MAGKVLRAILNILLRQFELNPFNLHFTPLYHFSIVTSAAKQGDRSSACAKTRSCIDWSNYL